MVFCAKICCSVTERWRFAMVMSWRPYFFWASVASAPEILLSFVGGIVLPCAPVILYADLFIINTLLIKGKKMPRQSVSLENTIAELELKYPGLVLEELFGIPGEYTSTGFQPKKMKSVRDIIKFTGLKQAKVLERLEKAIELELGIEISCESLHTLLSKEGGTVRAPVLLDVRQLWEFQKVKLKGSVLLDNFDFAPWFRNTLGKGSRVVTICHHGIRSYKAAMYLRQQGMSQAVSLAGGLDQWARLIDPSMERY